MKGRKFSPTSSTSSSLTKLIFNAIKVVLILSFLFLVLNLFQLSGLFPNTEPEAPPNVLPNPDLIVISTNKNIHSLTPKEGDSEDQEDIFEEKNKEGNFQLKNIGQQAKDQENLEDQTEKISNTVTLTSKQKKKK